MRTDDGYYGFIEAFTSEGMVRLPLPTKVMEALYRQHKAMVKKSKSDRAKRAAETRAANGVVPFVKTEADDLDDEVDIDDGEE